MKNKKTLSIIVIAIAAFIVICGGYFAYELLYPQITNKKTAYVFLDRDDSLDSLYYKVEKVGEPHSMKGMKWVFEWMGYGKKIKTGRYAIKPGISMFKLARNLARGTQSPIMLTIPSVRTLDKMAKTLSKQLMLDSTEIAQPIFDSVFYTRMGYTKETLPCLFIPNTYEVYWNISAKDLMKRIQKEHDNFWNNKRKSQATAIGLSPEQVTTLASIVEEETANDAEKPMIAGLYMNRYHQQMPLQADPTIKFALKDFSLRRILHQHLTVKSPYNTYTNLGLPPGPIRVPSIVGINSVLNYVHHNYIYMCAKEDFSGTHNFAATLTDHAVNARKYWKALNERNIK